MSILIVLPYVSTTSYKLILEWGVVTTESYFFAFARSSTADIQNGGDWLLNHYL